MGEHRSTANPDTKTKGNFRLRQHYACSDGYCTRFRIFVIQKLPGSGRLVEGNLHKSGLTDIDPSITGTRKSFEDNWIRALHTRYPYGCSDRIDNLENKGLYNREFAKFISYRGERRRSWGKGYNKTDDLCNVVDYLIQLVDSPFLTSHISKVKRLLFPLTRMALKTVRELYLDKVFENNSLRHDISRRQLHNIITDDRSPYVQN